MSPSTTGEGSGTIRRPMMQTTRKARTRSPKRLNTPAMLESLPNMSNQVSRSDAR